LSIRYSAGQYWFEYAVPRLVAVVECDGPRHVQVVRRLPHVAEHVLERELRCVHADDLQAVLVVGGVPRAQVRERPQAIDARVRPEVDEYDLAAQQRERLRALFGRVQPVGDPDEVGCRAEHGK